MKKGLHTLIRLQKRQVDTLRREIATVEERRESLIRARRERQAELVREERLAMEDILLARAFPPFAQQTKRRMEVLAQEIESAGRTIEALQEVLRGQFAELKKYEIARDKRLRQEKREREHREQIALDEIGISIFNRKESDQSGS